MTYKWMIKIYDGCMLVLML